MSINQTAFRFGLWLGLAEVAYGIFFRVVGFHHQSPWGWVFYAMLPAAVWLAQAAYCRRRGGPSYVEGVRLGAIATATGAAIYCLQVWAYNRFVDDSLLIEVRETQLARLGATATDPATIGRLDLLLQPAVFAAAVWVQLTMAGVVAALVIAAFRRESSPAPRRSGA